MDCFKAIVKQIRDIETLASSGSLSLLSARADTGHKPPTRETVRIHFDKGSISRVSSNSSNFRCGQYFLKAGVIDNSELRHCLDTPGSPLLGQKLVDLGLVDAVRVQAILYQQASEIFRHVLEIGFHVKSFEPTSLAGGIPLGANLDRLLLDLARANNKKVPDVQPNQRIVLQTERDLTRFPWAPEEIAVLAELRAPRTVRELAMASGLSEDQVRSVLRIMRQMGIVEVVERKAEEGTPEQNARPHVPLASLVPRARNCLLSEQVETAHREHSFIAEQFASLKVLLKESLKQSSSPLIAVTSPHMQDGKSLVAANLAFSFARDYGKRTILVDLDLRRPSVDRYLGIPSEPGLIGYLAHTSMNPFCFMRRVEDLFVMTAGGTAENPVELLSVKEMRELMEYLRKEFDLVLLDTPPLNPISDTRIISSLVDGVVMVVRRGKTPFSTIEKAIKAVDRKKVLGVVFNEVEPLMFHTYYNYSYYGYGRDSAYPYKPDDGKGGRRRQSRKSR